jgi:hypothetical protein
VPTPGDCTDGFFEAFWNRPEALLDPQVRGAQSMWALLDDELQQQMVARLEDSLATGEWDERYGALRGMDSFDGSLRLIVSEP